MAMDKHRDDHGHFVGKEQAGEQCPHEAKDRAIKEYFEAEIRRADEFFANDENYRISRRGNRILIPEKAKEAGFNTLGNPFNFVYRDAEEGIYPEADYDPELRRVKYIGNFSDVFPDAQGAIDAERKRVAAEKETKAREARYAKEMEESDKEADKVLAMSDDEIWDRLSGDPITRGERVGGYIGRSRSESAAYSEELGSKPMSKWKKNDLIEEIIGGDDEMPKFEKKLRGLSFAALKRVALYEDGWHHVGAFMTPTTFYAVNSPRDIVLNLKKELNGQAKAARKAARESKEKKVFGV